MGFEALLTWIALALYVVLMLLALAGFGTFHFNGREIKSPLLRLVMVVVGFPLIGVLCAIFGLIGWFFLLPFIAAWQFIF